MDSRRFRRAHVRVPVFISANGKLFRKSVALESRDISGGGLSFETSRKLPLDANSKIVLSDVGDLPAGALIEGRIARTEEDRETGRYVVGVEFVRFVNVTRDELLERVGAWEAQAPPEETE